MGAFGFAPRPSVRYRTHEHQTYSPRRVYRTDHWCLTRRSANIRCIAAECGCGLPQRSADARGGVALGVANSKDHFRTPTPAWKTALGWSEANEGRQHVGLRALASRRCRTDPGSIQSEPDPQACDNASAIGTAVWTEPIVGSSRGNGTGRAWLTAPFAKLRTN